MDYILDSLGKIDPFSYLALGVLFVMSVYSWAVIIQKFATIKSMEKHTLNYISEVLSEVDLPGMLAASKSYETKSSNIPAQRVLMFCVNALMDIKRKPQPTQNSLNVDRMLIRASDAAIASFAVDAEKKLGILASIGATAPFVGLFGTVTGVVGTLYGIGADGGQVQFNVVAPGLSVALVATAFGLFVAIPAVLYFNYFRSKIRFLHLTINEFRLKLVNRLTALI